MGVKSVWQFLISSVWKYYSFYRQELQTHISPSPHYLNVKYIPHQFVLKFPFSLPGIKYFYTRKIVALYFEIVLTACHCQTWFKKHQIWYYQSVKNLVFFKLYVHFILNSLRARKWGIKTYLVFFFFFFFFFYSYCLAASGPRFIAWKQFYLESVSSYLLKSFLFSWPHLSHSPLKSSLVFLYLFFSPFWLPLPVSVFCNLAFLPHGHTTVYFFFVYNLGLVLDLMFLWFYYFSIYPF